MQMSVLGFIFLIVGFLGASFLLMLIYMFNAWGTVIWQIWAIIILFIILFAVGMRVWIKRWKTNMLEISWQLKTASILCLALGLLTLLGLVSMAEGFIMITFVAAEMGMYPEASPVYMISLIPIFLVVGYFYTSLHIKNLRDRKGHILIVTLCVFGSLTGVYVAQFSFNIFTLLSTIYTIANMALIVLVLLNFKHSSLSAQTTT